jgi:hypothetical protein
MAFTIELADNQQYLSIRAIDNLTAACMRKVMIAVQGKAIRHGMSKFLFDVRNAENVESAATNYSYVYNDLAQMNMSRTAQCAILASPDDGSHNFMETLCRNAGYDVMLFTDMAKAIGWPAARPRAVSIRPALLDASQRVMERPV